MAPDYGATMGFFPVDKKTIDYLTFTGREPSKVRLIEAYLKAQGLFRVNDGSQKEPKYSGEYIELDLSTINPCIAGPKRPEDKIELSNLKKDFQHSLTAPVGFKGYGLSGEEIKLVSNRAF